MEEKVKSFYIDKRRLEDEKQKQYNFIKSKYSDIEFHVDFSLEPLLEYELQKVLDDYRRDDGTYWYQGEKIGYSHLREILKNNIVNLVGIFKPFKPIKIYKIEELKE